MKSYVYTILLLMCIGLSLSDVKITTGCLFGSRIFKKGEHTFRMKDGCMQLLCDGNGDISFSGCPSYNCDYLGNYDITGWTVNLKQEFPGCCKQPVCVSRDPIDHPVYE